MLDVKKETKTKMIGTRFYQDQVDALERISKRETEQNGDIVSISALIRLAVDDLILKYNELEKNNSKVD